MYDAHNASVSGSIVVINELKLEWSQCVKKNTLTLLWGTPILRIPLPPPIYIPTISEKHVAGVAQTRFKGLYVKGGKWEGEVGRKRSRDWGMVSILGKWDIILSASLISHVRARERKYFKRRKAGRWNGNKANF